MEPIKAVSPTVSGTDKSGESYRKWKLFRLRSHVAFLFENSRENTMKQNRLNLYLIDMKYIRDLAKADDHVMSVSPQISKEKRPFVGIIIVCGTEKYCVPLSSPKPKHAAMKNDVDFTKIYDGEKLIGVLNFNNMIPVDEQFIRPLNIKPSPSDNANTIHYKKMSAKQLTYCQRNQEAIVRKANKLYELITSGKANSLLKRRCCDFSKLEAILKKKL